MIETWTEPLKGALRGRCGSTSSGWPVGDERAGIAADRAGAPGQRIGPGDHGRDRAHAAGGLDFLAAFGGGGARCRPGGLFVGDQGGQPGLRRGEGRGVPDATAGRVPGGDPAHPRRGSWSRARTARRRLPRWRPTCCARRARARATTSVPRSRCSGPMRTGTRTASCMVAEGDESDGTLALYRPAHAIVLNVEAEHLDYYRDLDEIRAVFGKFLEQTPGADDLLRRGSGGRASLCGARDGASATAGTARDYCRRRRSASCAEPSAFTVSCGAARNSARWNSGSPAGTTCSMRWRRSAPGRLGSGPTSRSVARALRTFRRGEAALRDEISVERFRIVDDYGHHPTEIAATLADGAVTRSPGG